MKKLLALSMVIIVVFTLGLWKNSSSASSNSKVSIKTQSKNQKKPNKVITKKILVAYFSQTGHTEFVAKQIHENAGGDIFKIVTVQKYPTDYDALVDKAKQEQEDNYRPKLATKVKNMSSYDVIFVGYPNWWGTMPMPVFTFLKEYNFSGKTIVPFCTHEGSEFGSSIADIKKLCPHSKIIDGIAIRGGEVKNAKNDILKWLKKIGMLKKK